MNGTYITDALAAGTCRKTVRDAIERDEFSIVEYGGAAYCVERGGALSARLQRTITNEMRRLYPRLRRVY